MATYIEKLLVAIGLDASDLKKGLQAVGKDAANAEKAYGKLGDKWASTLKGVVTNVVAPLSAGFAIFKSITGYANQVGEVARLTGAYSTKLEEWRKKRALLARVNQEDIELYKKGREAITSFQITMDDLSAKLFRNFAPALRFGIELLNKLTQWISNNKDNLARFFMIAGTAITVFFLPALAKMAIALLANPITWIVIALGALIAIIDDLVVYMRGGQSALSGFWSYFGTGQELSEKLTKVFNTLLSVVKFLAPALIALGGAFAAVKLGIVLFGGFRKAVMAAHFAIAVFKGGLALLSVGMHVFAAVFRGVLAALRLGAMIFGLLQKAILAVRAAFVLLAANPIVLVLMLIISLVVYIVGVFRRAGGDISQVFSIIAEDIKAVADRVFNFFANLLGLSEETREKIKNFALGMANTIKEKFAEAWEFIKNLFDPSQLLAKVKGAFKGAFDGVKSFLGFGDDEEATANASSNGTIAWAEEYQKNAPQNATQTEMYQQSVAQVSNNNNQSTNKNVTQNNNITINTNSDDPNAVKRAVNSGLDEQNYKMQVMSVENGTMT